MSLITALISASGIILGSLIGAIFSWVITKKTTYKTINEQYRIQEVNRKYEESYKIKEICTYANVIRLDLCTAMFQSIRCLQDKDNSTYLYIVPISKEYQKAVASLSDKYSLKELSYIYQLYGIIEKVNRDIYNWNNKDKETFEYVIMGYKDIVKKMYGENYDRILAIDIDKLSYKDLYNNDLIKIGYKRVLKTLDDLCFIENLTKEKTNKNIIKQEKNKINC